MSKATLVKTLLTTTTLATALAASPQAFAGTQAYIPGSVCQATQGAVGCVDYSQYGVHNTCSYPVVVDCPLSISVNSSAGNSTWWATFYPYNRSSWDVVSCTLQQTGSDGNVWYQSSMNSFLGGPDSAVQALVINNGATLFSNWWHLRCSIPGVETPGWYSHVTAINIGSY